MKANSWISVSFDSLGAQDLDTNASSSSSNSRKRRREDPPSKDVSSSQTWLSGISKKLEQQPSTDLWVEKYSPKSKDELAVHKKKVADVEGWLQTHLNRTKYGSQFLLLTGPAGAGKTATIKTLAQHHKLEVQEWVNPITDSFISNPDLSGLSDFVPMNYGTRSESQTTQFKDFLLRANKYCSLSLAGEASASKLLLVEEFPNVFFRDSQQFHSILRDFAKKSQCPLVFIISDNVGGESYERFLFPKDLQMELQITNISFNPVANTMMNKVLQKIMTAESLPGWKTQKAAKSTLESLVVGSNGDIRAAINALQFSGRGSEKRSSGKQKTSKKTSSTRGKDEDEENGDVIAIGAKDTSMFLFRALGKILYCKRGNKTDSSPESYKLPSHLKQHERDPLQFNPEEVLEKSHISGDFFMAYLHQNYVDFFPNLEDVTRAADYLSEADLLMSDWTNRTQLQEYAACIATRGLLHSNTARATSSSGGSGLGWKPLHKPQWYSTIRKAKENVNMVRVYFKGHCWTPVELQTQYIPFASLLNRRTGNAVQNRFIQEIGSIKSSKFCRRVCAEKLNETDVDLLQDDDSLQCAPVAFDNDNPPETSQVPEEDDVVIDDYDSD